LRIFARKLFLADFCNNIRQNRTHAPQQRSFLFDHLGGNTTERVIRHAPCPVLALSVQS